MMVVRISSGFLSIAFCWCLVGCDRATLMKKVTPAEDESFARSQVDLLRQQQFDQIERELDSGILDSNTRHELGVMAVMFPPEAPKSVKVVDVKFLRNPQFSAHYLTLEYEFPEKWLLVNMSITKKDGIPKIKLFRVTPIADSLESMNRFSLIGKSPMQYAVLGLAVIGPIFCLYVLVLCIRSKMGNHKWLWAFFILFGIGELAVNWTTGELRFTPFAFHIPCASATANPAYGPWVVAVSLPLGAILFLMNRGRTVAPKEAQVSPAGELPPTASE